MNYIFIGVLGTFGFSGSYFIGLGHTTMTQNCLNMFYADHYLVFLIRLVSFLQIFSVFPLIFHTCRTWFFRAFHIDDPSGGRFTLFNIGAFLVALIIAIVYPKVGQLLGLVGGIIGFG